MIIRKAREEDLDFIIECILESEKSGGDILSYLNVFSLTEGQFMNILRDIFAEDIEGQAWCLSHWYVGLDETNTVVAGLSAWIEGENGIHSDILKSQTLHYFLTSEWERSLPHLEVLAQVSIPRMKGHCQLEHLYSKPCSRGKGYMKKLIEEIMKLHPQSKFELQLLENNVSAMSLYTYMGFSVSKRKCHDEVQRLHLLSGKCKLQMIK
jgi:ribosomal protein S18 acetylase RimI-like enzyme